MLKKLSPFLVLLLIIFSVWYLFHSSMPRDVDQTDIPLTEFSTVRAFEHVENLSRAPHFVGSSNHSRVRNYIVDQLQELGLEVQTQEGYALNKNGSLSFAKNVLARLPGTGEGKSLLLMTHYDSAGNSSPGASDAASGVATILEGLRTFLAHQESHYNDIIILITDVEEVGLLGARLFVKEHPWAKDIGLALNFEARGSGGNSFMLLETNEGNSKLINHFIDASPQYPVTNSLAYSVYKMLPNDTDLTVLREQGDIIGFNFAFIDDHFDYHTANDTPANLDKETLAHQGSYLMPLLSYFKDADLTDLDAAEDLIYFTTPPGKIISYPFSWSIPLLIAGLLLFFVVVIYGITKKELKVKTIIKGAVPYLLSLLGAGILIYLLWQFCLMIYPIYGEMEHGFTYNGYYYIAASVFLTLTICFLVYNLVNKKDAFAGYLVFPLFFWLFICALATLYLEGAAYFIIPFFFGCLQLWVMLRQKRPNLFLMFLLSLPALILLQPFLVNFAVALGLRILFVTSILTTLLFSLFLPVFFYFKRKKALALLCFLIFNILFITAHFKSGFNEERQKPNSLVYLYDADSKSATWNSYDKIIDSWTSPYFGDDPVILPGENDFASKYSSGFTFKASAPLIEIPQPAIIFDRLENDTLTGEGRFSLKIAPNRKIHRIELFAERDANFEDFTVNGLRADSTYLGKYPFHIFSKRWQKRLLIYHAANRDTLQIEFRILEEDLPDFTLYEASYDLLDNEALQVKVRDRDMIPRPFVLNDAVIYKRIIKFEDGQETVKE